VMSWATAFSWIFGDFARFVSTLQCENLEHNSEWLYLSYSRLPAEIVVNLHLR
jgi:hypothetical protein